ncbi:MAG: cytochrome c3 family protein, partial [Opitutaceae bacterium]
MVSKTIDAPAFAGQTAEAHAAAYVFETDVSGELVIREALHEGAQTNYRPSMVIARTPLWQYLVETEPGRFQATEVAWDPAHEEWFAVFGEEERNPGEWGHWKGRGMNWNSMCARCHMTAYVKNYDSLTDRYDSQWTEHGIGCIQCHNIMSGHEAGGAAMAGIDNFARDPQRMMHTCASCHSRAESLTAAFVPGEPYDDHFRLQLPAEPGLYHPDGQILDEVFVFGSFRHSKMHAAGVTCMDCHEPHSGALKLPQENNQICLQCHSSPGRLNAPVIDPTAHSFHQEGSVGNRCVECHMMKTTYMQRDPRRDHGFIIPDPVLTKELGVPNACSRCHTDQTLEWNIEHYENWFGAKRAQSPDRERALAIDSAYKGDAAA